MELLDIWAGSMNNFFIALAILISGGILPILFCNKVRGFIFTLHTLFALFFISKCVFPVLQNYNPIAFFSQSITYSFPIGHITFVIDSLTAFFVAIISLGILFNSFYAWVASSKNKETSRFHFFFLSLITVSMLIVVTVSNMIVFIVAWEIMTMSSFALIMLHHDKLEQLPFKINYLVAMHIGMLFIMGAFLFVCAKTNSNSMYSISALKGTSAAIVFVLLFVGFAFKTEFVPFHPWLPIVHPEIPSHVSAILSGIMMKTGLYGILRIICIQNRAYPSISFIVLIVGIVTALYGIIFASSQRDVKKLLAYSSIENMGICCIGVGGGMVAMSYGYVSGAFFSYAGALLHALNHSLFKPLLFYVAGTVERITKIRDMELLGGIIKKFPYIAYVFLFGAMAISGLPLLNGFVSEFCIYMGLLKGTVQGSTTNAGVVIVCILAVSFLALTGAVAIITFTKVFSIVFLGTPRKKIQYNGKSLLLEIIPSSVIVVIMFLISLLPHKAIQLVKNPVEQIICSDVSIYFVNSYTLLSKLSFILVSLFTMIILFMVLRYVATLGRIKKSTTWGCGYNKPSAKIQYTGYSFSENFTTLFSTVLDIHNRRKMPNTIFVEKGSFFSYCFDCFDSRIYRPLMKRIRMLMSMFAIIQSGNTQLYILYMLAFTIGVILWIIIGG